MSEETLELKVKLDDLDAKNIVYQYLKTCDGQLNPRQCAEDLHIDIEDVIKAITLLEGEGKIKVEAEKPPITETTLGVTEPQETQVAPPVTPPKEIWNEPPIPPQEESIIYPPIWTVREQTQAQPLLPVEPMTSPDKIEVTAIELKKEPAIALAPIPPEITSTESSTEAPEPKLIAAHIEDTLPMETPTEASATEPTPQTVMPSQPVEVLPSNATETPPPKRSPLGTIVISEEHIILKKLVSRPNPNPEPQQIKNEIPATTQPPTITPVTPIVEIPKHAVCPKCGLPNDFPLKHWSIKGRIAKKKRPAFSLQMPHMWHYVQKRPHHGDKRLTTSPFFYNPKLKLGTRIWK